MPFFSIIIPTYNRAAIIGRAVEQVLNQRFTDFELIVADDGSSDETETTLLPYLQDARVTYKKQPNKGVCAARNLGARLARGNYLVFLDSDDSISPAWLQGFYDTLQQQPAEVVFCDMKEIHADGSENNVRAEKPYANSSVKGKYIAGMFAIQKTIFDEIGGYDEQLKFGENTELGIRLRMKNVSMSFVNTCHFFYHVSSSGGGKNWQNKLDSNTRIVEKHPSYFLEHPITKKLFLQVAAVAAVKIGEYQQANRIFGQLKTAFPKDLKVRLQYYISSMPWLAKRVWKAK